MRGIAALAALCLIAREPAPQAKTDPSASFRTALDQAGRSMSARRWSSARETILAALEAHRDADYVLEALPEVLEDLRRSTFWSKTEPPKPKDVVAGELLEYEPKTGQVKIRYRADAKKRSDIARRRRGTRKLPFETDFVDHDEVYVHPLVFKGPYSIEVRCGPIAGHSPRLAVCMEPSGFFLAIAASPALIYRVEGGKRHTVAVLTNSISFADRARIRVDVRESQIALSMNDAQIATCEKPKGSFGQAGFYDFPDVEEIVVTGRAEPAWIEGLVDAEVQKLQAAFEKEYDPEKDLPQCLRKHAAKTASAAETQLFALAPGGDSPDRAARIASATELSEKGKWKDGIELARSWKEPADASLRAWYSGLFLLAGGHEADALAELRRTAEMEPKFFPARRLLWQEAAEGESRTRAIADAEALALELPEEPGARELLVTAYLLAGKRAEAKAALESAAKEGLSSSGLAKLRRSLAQATQGPEWNRAYEYKSAHYEIRSDLSQDLCFEASKILEASFDKLDLHLRRVAGDRKSRFRVYLFSGRAGYHAYAKDVLGYAPENTAGVYSSVLKQLLVWNLPEREAMLRTIRHEGFHQYFDQVVDHSPRWLNEGLAEYFELSRLEGGQWRDGAVQSGHVARLRAGDALVPLAEFLEMGPGPFYARAPEHYAEGWALVHWLLESGAGPRKRFDSLIDALAAGRSTHEAIAASFPAKDLPEVEKAFRAHLDELEE